MRAFLFSFVIKGGIKMFDTYNEAQFRGLYPDTKIIGKVFASKADAEEYLDDSIPGVRACKFALPIDLTEIDKDWYIKNSHREVKQIAESQKEFNNRTYLSTITSKLHTCPGCGSKINRTAYLTAVPDGKSNFCPICGEDLRPEGMRKRNEGYSNKITQIYKNIYDREQELIKGRGITPQELILVRHD